LDRRPDDTRQWRHRLNQRNTYSSQAVIAKLNGLSKPARSRSTSPALFPLDRVAEAHRALDDHYLDKLALRFS
jgi:hypothetical protein